MHFLQYIFSHKNTLSMFPYLLKIYIQHLYVFTLTSFHFSYLGTQIVTNLSLMVLLLDRQVKHNNSTLVLKLQNNGPSHLAALLWSEPLKSMGNNAFCLECRRSLTRSWWLLSLEKYYTVCVFNHLIGIAFCFSDR